jgi:hypothetical protein
MENKVYIVEYKTIPESKLNYLKIPDEENIVYAISELIKRYGNNINLKSIKLFEGSIKYLKIENTLSISII